MELDLGSGSGPRTRDVVDEVCVRDRVRGAVARGRATPNANNTPTLPVLCRGPLALVAANWDSNNYFVCLRCLIPEMMRG